MFRRLLVVAVLGLGGAALACLWDSDTYSEEALKQKDVAAIVGGRLGKHSTYFYEQKIAYTLPMVEAGDAGMERYDDLAVAYDKLGKLDDAIAVMSAKELRFPHEYTTLANRGSFYAHQGNFAKALEQLNAALVLNPGAHFGREKYQVRAIEYLQALAQDPTLVEREDLLGVDVRRTHPLLFGDGFKKGKGQPTKLDEAGISRDVFVALAGIIRYGSGEKSPHVWFSLGVASALDGDRHLALRAFARAHHLGHPRALEFVNTLSSTIKEFGNDEDLDRMWTVLAKEWSTGDAAMKASQAKEDAQLKAGKRRQVFGY